MVTGQSWICGVDVNCFSEDCRVFCEYLNVYQSLQAKQHSPLHIYSMKKKFPLLVNPDAFTYSYPRLLDDATTIGC